MNIFIEAAYRTQIKQAHLRVRHNVCQNQYEFSLPVPQASLPLHQ